jgi:hypothetical protein
LARVNTPEAFLVETERKRRKSRLIGRHRRCLDQRCQRTLVTSAAVNHSSIVPKYVRGMDETQDLAVQALCELLDDPDRNDWDELLAANRALIKAIATGGPMTRRNLHIVAEYLREAGWREHAIGEAMAEASATGYTNLRETG